MDIDAMKQKRANAQCFKCLQKGHFARNCPVKNIRELSEETRNEILQMHLAKVQEEPEEEIDLLKPYAGKLDNDEVILEHDDSDDELPSFY